MRPVIGLHVGVSKEHELIEPKVILDTSCGARKIHDVSFEVQLTSGEESTSVDARTGTR